MKLKALHLSRDSNMVGYTKNRIQCFKIKAQLKAVLGGFERRLKFIKFGLCSD